MKKTDANAGNEIIFELQDRIDEAIKYIENNKYDFEKWETQMLLDILKGSDKE